MGLDVNINRFKIGWVMPDRLKEALPVMDFDKYVDIFNPEAYPEYLSIFHWRHMERFKNFMLKSKYAHPKSNEDGIIVCLITEECRNDIIKYLNYSLVEEDLNSDEYDFEFTLKKEIKKFDLEKEIFVLDISW